MKLHEFLGRVHEELRPATYLEIGINRGGSLALSRTKSIGIDPAFSIVKEINCDVSLVRATSDDFFARRDPLVHFGGNKIEFTFIDGLHRFEYALRDFMNIERHSDWATVIVFDDMLPRSADEGARNHHVDPWAGDVYKMTSVLRHYRPDLFCLLLDTRPTGLLLVLGADSSNTVLADNYERIVAEHATPDPQRVPDEILHRTEAVPGERVAEASLWRALREARVRSTPRAEGLQILADFFASLRGSGKPMECRATSVRQSDVGVLRLRCTLSPVPTRGLDGTEVVFLARDGHDEHSHPLRHLRTHEAALFEARIRLSDGEQSFLPPGVWDLRVRHQGSNYGSMPLRAPSYGRGQWPTIMVPAPGGPYTVSFSTQRDVVTLRVARVQRYVEVERVVIQGATLTIDAHLVPHVAPYEHEGKLVMQSRQREDVAVSQTIELSEGKLRASVDLEELPSEGPEDWDFYLRLDGKSGLRLGSHLDEIGNKRKIFSFPSHSVEKSGRSLTLQPVYTVDNDLSVRTRSAEASQQNNGQPVSQRTPGTRRRASIRPVRLLISLLLSIAEILGHLRRPRSSSGRRKVYFLLYNAFANSGVHRTVLNLANHLAQDHDVEVISVVRTRRRPFFQINPRVKLTFLLDEVALRESPPSGPKSRLRNVLNARSSWMIHEEDPAFHQNSLWLDLKMWQHLNRLSPGVLITTRVCHNVIAARFARPGVTTVGQEHISSTIHGDRALRQIRHHYPKLDALTVLTLGDERDYRELLSGANIRVVRIPNALPEKPTARADLDSGRVIAAGRYAPQKGFDLLVPAFGRVVRKHPEWHLRVYGGGRDFNRLQCQIRDLDLYNHVLLMEPTDQLGEELARSSIFALSSRFEGLPMVIIEAMAVGLPVVSFDCPRGPSDIITDGVDGTLVPPEDPDALATAILDLVEDPDKRRAYSEAALKTAKSYEIDVIGRAWRRTFDELLGPATD